jgi:type I restriction-modification system DNA methylase subunit
MGPPQIENLSPSTESFTRDLEKLLKRFEADKFHYLSKDYSEAQARVDFISPFFRILGWDVENEEGLTHHDREVIVERGEKDTPGRPDYSFRIAGQTKFFVEAKAPCESLGDSRHIFQAKSYAWSTNSVSFVVLTDFEEFRFYDATVRPDERKPAEGLLLSLTYTDFLKNAAKLWDFSRERVRSGSLEALLPRDRRTARLRIPPDESFLDQMTAWREDLARNVYKNNPDLTAKQLNEIVQRLLDRIVFIRIAEDRRVVEKNLLRDVVDEWKARGNKLHIFDWLNDLFHRINEDFNGEIFKPHLSEEIKVDSEVLAHIIENLYAPKSPFRFDVIGVELLGSIYERYLGKTIRPTSKQVRVEEKPEVRKAGGVYYTPKYIVDYIVKNTVGKIVEGKTPKQIEKMRILDPACGSGSFLIGAFQYLIDYHVRYFAAHPEEVQTQGLFPDLIKDENGEPRLSVVRKADILKNNLFGVDIDPQAVEITMMSLYLKALEGERSQLPPKHHILPELKYNIICGNSLIGPDIFGQGTLFADEERDRINSFDWNSERAGFGKITKAGGFDCVIGNPPYGATFSQTEKDYLNICFRYQNYQLDSYLLFMEKALHVAKTRGFCGLIIPNPWLTNLKLDKIRRFVSSSVSVSAIVHFKEKVFPKATVDTEIVIMRKEPPGRANISVEIVTQSTGERRLNPIPQSRWRDLNGGTLNIFLTDSQFKLADKIQRRGSPLHSLCETNVGIKPYQVGKGKPRQTRKDVVNRVYDAETKKNGSYKPYLRGSDLRRYAIVWGGSRWIKFGPWLAEPRPAADFSSPEKILVRQTGDSLVAALDTRQFLSLNNTHVVVRKQGVSVPLTYILGIVNSQLMNFYYQSLNPEVGEALAEVKAENLGKLPIRTFDTGEPAEFEKTGQLVLLVQQMLELSKRYYSGKLAPSELERLRRETAAKDAEINNFVYELYGLTSDEKRIVEEASDE